MNRARAFTLVEAIAVVAIVLVLAVLLPPALGAWSRGRGHRHGRPIHCLGNLKQSLLFQIMFSNDHDGKILTYAVSEPDAGGGDDTRAQATWSRVLYETGYLTDAKLVFCPERPADRAARRFPSDRQNSLEQTQPLRPGDPVPLAGNHGWQTLSAPAVAADFDADAFPQWETYGIYARAADGIATRGEGAEWFALETVIGGKRGADVGDANRPVMTDAFLHKPDRGLAKRGFARFSPFDLPGDIGLAQESALAQGRIPVGFADGHAESLAGPAYLEKTVKALGAPPEGLAYRYADADGVVQPENGVLP